MIDTLVFKSKVDLWLLVAIDVVVFYACYSIIQSGAVWTTMIGKLALIVGLMAYITYVLFYIKYEFRGSYLVIYYQPFVKRSIKIDKIKRVEATCNPLSAPAASLDRLKLTYVGGSILVSPKDKVGFIAYLQHSNPNIKVEL